MNVRRRGRHFITLKCNKVACQTRCLLRTHSVPLKVDTVVFLFSSKINSLNIYLSFTFGLLSILRHNLKITLKFINNLEQF